MKSLHRNDGGILHFILYIIITSHFSSHLVAIDTYLNRESRTQSLAFISYATNRILVGFFSPVYICYI